MASGAKCNTDKRTDSTKWVGYYITLLAKRFDKHVHELWRKTERMPKTNCTTELRKRFNYIRLQFLV